jgi:hypothetical protein
MSALFSPQLNAATHQDDAVNGLKANIFQRAKDYSSSAIHTQKLD